MPAPYTVTDAAAFLVALPGSSPELRFTATLWLPESGWEWHLVPREEQDGDVLEVLLGLVAPAGPIHPSITGYQISESFGSPGRHIETVHIVAHGAPVEPLELAVETIA
ncbi:hypothetical protein [Schumannella luteola]|jgi:hypothetical protein